ncbi:MAG: heavy metal translocating P-type ATPase [Candidatus Izemoplasmataceae bacterium]
MIKKAMRVDGMTCAMCAKTIQNTFDDLDGITARVNVGAGKVLFEYDEDKYSMVDIAEKVRQVGYQPILEESLDDSKNARKKMRKDIYIAVIFSIPLLWAMFHHIDAFSWLYVPTLFTNGIFQLVTAGVVQFYIGKRFYKGAYQGIKKKSLGMDILVVLGTTSAYLYSIYLLIEHTFITEQMMPMYYFEISALIITMVLIGNYIEHIAKERTTDALVELLNLGAKEARILRDGQEIMVDIDEVGLGDQVIVLANEKIPVDGIVVDGKSFVDESMITGESIPIKKEQGAKVIGATINKRERLLIEATKIGSDTMLNQIIQHVEEASSEKPPIQRTADKVASYFVPAVVSIAILNFIIHFLFLSDGFTYSFTTTVAILVISCPCALGLATPVSILVGNGKAAQNHILYKGGEFFEVASKIQAIAFDKTGTLTIGKPIVTDYIGDEKVISLLYSLEKESNHPISQAVKEYAIEKEAEDYKVSNFDTIEGKGIKGTVNGHEVMVGSIKILDDVKLSLDTFEKEYNQLLNQAKTINFVVVDNEIKALYAVRDEIKPTSKRVIEEMKKRGLTPYMITGDNKVVAEAIASELGIEHVYSEVLPHEKADIVKEISSKGIMLAFVGDGINDAPALKLADVGFAMGHGTDVAIDSSDVTLMSHDLGLVLKAIDMSKATLKNIYQNFFWAFSYNLVAIPLAATGRLSMVLAAAAMAFSSIMVVLNALRLKATKLPDFTMNEEDLEELIETQNSKEKGEDKMEIKVTDMTCNHCKMTIEKALEEKGFKDVKVDLENKVVNVDLQGKEESVAVDAITAKGYTVER